MVSRGSHDLDCCYPTVKGVPHLATKVKAVITPEALSHLERLRDELDAKVEESKNTNDLYMHGVYTELLAIIANRIVKIGARRTRQRLAEHRKEHKALRDNLPPIVPASR